MSSLLKTETVLKRVSGASTASKGMVRPVMDDDLHQIAELYQVSIGPLNGSARLLQRLFFEVPWQDSSLSSLIYEDGRGRMLGCLGIMPRPMAFRGRTVRAAVGHHLMVQPTRQGIRAGVELARHLIKGDQDLCVAVGNDFSRRIWEFVGGSVSRLHSLSWTRPLRPARYALGRLKLRGLSNPAAATLIPACQAVDATLNIFAPKAVQVKRPNALADELDAVTMLASLSAFADDQSLQPVYDASSLGWLVETMNQSESRGQLHRVAVRTHSGRALGWYLYRLENSGVAEVLQVVATDETVGEVLNHLFYHADRRGAVAVNGSMDTRLFRVLSERECVFQRRENSWTLFHSRDRQIADAIQTGDAFISGLERAWWGGV